MTDPPDLYCLYTMIFYHHRANHRLHHSALPSMLSRSSDPLCLLFALSRRPCPIAPCSAFKRFCFPDFLKQYQGVTNPLIGPPHPDPFSAPTLSL